MYYIYNINNLIITIYISRRRVIASLQSIIMYEYLPSFLGEEVAAYPGYRPDTHPGISHVFQSAAFRSVSIFLLFDNSNITSMYLHYFYHFIYSEKVVTNVASCQRVTQTYLALAPPCEGLRCAAMMDGFPQSGPRKK